MREVSLNILIDVTSLKHGFTDLGLKGHSNTGFTSHILIPFKNSVAAGWFLLK